MSNSTQKGRVVREVGGIVVHFGGGGTMTKGGGLGGRMLVTASAAFIGSLSLMGFPSTNGFFSEFLLFQGGFVRATTAFSDYHVIVAILGVVATAFTAGYSLLALRKIFFGPANGDSANVKEAPWTITLPLVVLSIVTEVLGIYPGPIISRFAAIGKAIAGA